MSKQDDKETSPVTTDDKPTPAGTVELQEDELDQVVGGRKSGEGQKDFLKITMKEVFIST